MERTELLNVLKDNGLTLSSMESVTGGLFAAAFTALPGASEVFKGAAVTYQDEVKEAFGVRKESIEKFGAISIEVAREMAVRASMFFNTTVSVSFTGNAGPEAQEGKPLGLIYIAIRIKDKLFSYKLQFQGERDVIRKQCVDFAFTTIYEKIMALA